MAKRSSLKSAMKQASGSEEPVAVQEEELVSGPPVKTQPSRVGTKAITGHFDPAVSKQVKQLALEQDTTMQKLLAEALNDLFVKYGKSPIAKT